MIVKKTFKEYTDRRKREYPHVGWIVTGWYLFGIIPLYIKKEELVRA